VEKKDLEEIKQKLKEGKSGKGTGTKYSEKVKKEVIDFKNKHGLTMNKTALLLGIQMSTISYWVKHLNNDRTGFVHGTSLRNDLRTKALAVKEFVEYDKSEETLAHKYDVSKFTIRNWVSRYAGKYKEYLELPEGIATDVSDEKLVIGSENIKLVKDLLSKQQEVLNTVIARMHLGLTRKTMKELETKIENIEKKKKILEDADKIISETKVEK
jgi:transposase-like protein